MTSLNKSTESLFWSHVLHRAEMQLMDMNVGDFYLWRKMLGDEKVNHLLTRMESLLSSDTADGRIMDFWCDNKYASSMTALMCCFGCSGKVITKKGKKGDIYCIPVLYVIISYLINDEKVDSSFHESMKNLDRCQKRSDVVASRPCTRFCVNAFSQK